MQSIIEKKRLDEINNVTASISLNERMFYVQLLMNKLHNIHHAVRNTILLNMRNQSANNHEANLDVLIGSGILLALSIIISLFLLYRMKRQYLKEVYMLTFLS